MGNTRLIGLRRPNTTLTWTDVPLSTVIGGPRGEDHPKPLTVVSPGTQRRNFTHVKDIVRGLLLVGEKGQDSEYGFGSERSYTVLEIAELFETGIQMIGERRGNRMDATLDLREAERLGWRAELSVEDYICAFIREQRAGS